MAGFVAVAEQPSPTPAAPPCDFDCGCDDTMGFIIDEDLGLFGDQIVITTW
jgi:hypothetical protein